VPSVRRKATKRNPLNPSRTTFSSTEETKKHNPHLQNTIPHETDYNRLFLHKRAFEFSVTFLSSSLSATHFRLLFPPPKKKKKKKKHLHSAYDVTRYSAMQCNDHSLA
jgi:hypothetical protein